MQVVSTVTYTLTQNCKATGRLLIGGLDAANPITVTINGGGYTVDASALTNVSPVIFVSGFTSFILNSVTIVGGGISYKACPVVADCYWIEQRKPGQRRHGMPENATGAPSSAIARQQSAIARQCIGDISRTVSVQYG